MISPSSRPYPYLLAVLPAATAYEFTTDSGVTYFITLTTGDYFPVSPLREHGIILGLELLDPNARDTGTDPRIATTVAAVIEQVLEQLENIIVWVCSPDREQQRARDALFNRWYRRYKRDGGRLNIIKKDVQPTPDEYVSVLYRAENRDREALERLLVEQVDKL